MPEPGRSARLPLCAVTRYVMFVVKVSAFVAQKRRCNIEFVLARRVYPSGLLQQNSDTAVGSFSSSTMKVFPRSDEIRHVESLPVERDVEIAAESEGRFQEAIRAVHSSCLPLGALQSFPPRAKGIT